MDSIAEYYAKMSNINLEVFYPVYKKYGKRAPLIRNNEIIKNCDGVLAIWDGESNGTAYTINKAKKENKTLLKPTMMMYGTFQNKDDQEKR